jgi:hypothetical protein
MFGYMMHASDNVLENLLTHKNVGDRVPEADPTRVHLELNIEPNVKGDDMDQLYDDLTKELKKRGPVDVHKDDIDWDILCRYLIKEASKDET